MQKQRGFTLIEIAIVLVIIGLLVGGVLKGQELIRSAQVRKAISNMDELKTAVFGFQDRFRALPGDMSNAATLVANGAVNCTWACNNGLIQPWRNTSLVTNNLSASNFYSGPFNTAETNAAPNSTNALANPWGGAMFIAYWNQFNVAGARSTSSVNGVYTGGSVPSTVLAEIDRKIDDGNSGTGSFRAAWPRVTTASCSTAAGWVIVGGNSNCAGVSLY